MILSHTHKYIFVKTGKTAGTSVQYILGQFCKDRDIVTPVLPTVEGYKFMNCSGDKRIHSHMTIQMVKSLFPSEHKEYFKFCFERNPWDKAVSLYWWERRCDVLDVDDFRNWCIRKYHGIGDFGRIYSIDGKVAVDKIFRYEKFKEELVNFCLERNIPWGGEEVFLKGEYRKDKRPYQEYFDVGTRDLISKHFEKIINFMCYEF